jgi:uncharacterized protein YbjT (DUF2867 family)
MNSAILVTGGTGTIGSRVVPLLQSDDRDLRILSRRARPVPPGVRHFSGDVKTGTGLAPALKGVQVVLHLAGGATGDDVAARTLVEAARAAAVEHVVLISVIGAGRMPVGYFRMKQAAEAVVMASELPWTVLRSAQLHDFVLPFVRGMARLPLVPAPRGMRFEPVEVDAVAGRLAELTLGRPDGLVEDIAGPEVLSIPELVEAFDDAQGRRRRMLPFTMPGAIGRAYSAGANLADGAVARVGHTWREHLATEHVSAS